MKNTRLLLSFVCSFNFFLANAQSTFKCGSDIVRQKLVVADPNYKKNLEDMDRGIRDYISTHPENATHTSANTLYYIPCVVHIIYDGPSNATPGTSFNPSDVQINNTISYINAVYDGTWTGTGGPILGAGDLQIKFVLATKNMNNVTTTGVDRVDGSGLSGYSAGGANAATTGGASEISVKNLSRWDPFKYYNIWVVNKIDGCTGYFCNCACDAGFIAGYAYFPPANNTNTTARDLDGTIMLASQFQSGEKTLPHELGHMLNLYHPFEGNGAPSNNCPPNATPATQGDMCADTDPVTDPSQAPNAFPFECRNAAPYTSPFTNPCVTTSTTAFNDNTEKNYMNYTNCYQLFTNNQKSRMQASVNTTMRQSLATSWANNQGNYPATFVAPGAASVTPNSLLVSNGAAGIMNLTLDGHSIYSLNATNDGGYKNNSGSWYDIFSLMKNTVYTMSVKVLGLNGEQLGVWIDYDNNGIFNNTTEQVYLNNNISIATAASPITFTFTTPTTWTNGSFVRLRVSEDLTTAYGSPTLSSSSASLRYGQAEDYSAYLNSTSLPVTLTDFNGQKNKNDILLSWSTSLELNTKLFDIERSLNGVNFSSIGTIPSKNAANGARYQYNDRGLSRGKYYYRLKMVDLDGSFKYSNILLFEMGSDNTIQVIGNPFHDNINLILPYTSGDADIKVSDATGKTLFIKKIILSGSNSINIPVKNNNLAAGLYILEVLVNGERFIQKIQKI